MELADRASSSLIYCLSLEQESKLSLESCSNLNPLLPEFKAVESSHRSPALSPGDKVSIEENGAHVQDYTIGAALGVMRPSLRIHLYGAGRSQGEGEWTWGGLPTVLLPAGWPRASHFTSLSLSVLCKMGNINPPRFVMRLK